MSRRKISQTEARRLRARVRELEEVQRKQRAAWVTEFPAGIYLWRWVPDPASFTAVRTARRLGHSVVLTHDDDSKEIRAYAVASA